MAYLISIHMYLHSAFHNAHRFKAALQKMHSCKLCLSEITVS